MDLFGRKASQREAIALAQMDVLILWMGELQDRLRALELSNAAKDRIITSLKQSQAVPHTPPPYPMYKSEEEEELDYALRNGQINKDEYRDLLGQLGFENTEVEIPERSERPIIY